MLDGEFVDQLLEETGQESTEKWSTDVHYRVVWLGLLGLWVGVVVGHLLENRLDEAYGWVDATSGNTAGFSHGAVKSKTNSHAVDWRVGGSVMLGDDQYESDEHESAHGLDSEHSKHIITIIVATVDWAELGNPEIIGANWNLFDVFLLEWESHEADGTSEDGTETLADNDEECEAQVSSEMSFTLFPEHADGHSRIEMSATYRSKHLSHNHDSESDCCWNRVGCTGPIDRDQEEASSEQLEQENEELVLKTAWDFHLTFVVIYYLFAKNLYSYILN